MVHLMEACLLTALQAYLLGSLLFGVLVSKLFYHDDVRLHGSGNAGMTNVLRTYGKLPAVIDPPPSGNRPGGPGLSGQPGGISEPVQQRRSHRK